MKRKRLLLCIPLLAITLSGCILEPQEIGPIPIPESEAGTLKPMASTLSPVDKINIKYQAGFKINEAEALFMPKGIIRGVESPLVPLDASGSDLDNMGFITYVSLDGRSATLTYGDAIVQLQVDDHTMFINNEPGIQLVDKPMFMNSTMYIPIIPVLKALDIHFVVEGDRLVIGGQYTDGTVVNEELQKVEVDTLPTTEQVEEEQIDGEPDTDSSSTGD